MMTTSIPLTVTDIKQYLYCPRIVYFTYVVAVRKVVTHKMEQGKLGHDQLDRLEKRRNLKRYRLDNGQRDFHVRLHSNRLGLDGILDCLIWSHKELYPVEYKFTRSNPGSNHRYQLTAYSMLAEENLGRPVRAGFLYLVPRDEVVPFEITDGMRRHVTTVCGAIRHLVQAERLPPATRNYAHCRDCEYRRYCRDVEEWQCTY